jgi:hypothetical protein
MDEYYPQQNDDDYQRHRAKDRHRQARDQDRFGQQEYEPSSKSMAKISEAVLHCCSCSCKLQEWIFPCLHY